MPTAIAIFSLLAACGEGDTSNPERIVRAAATDLAATTIDATYSMTFDFAGDTFTMEGDVAMDLRASVGRMTVRMDGVPGVPPDAQLKVVVDGDHTYYHDPQLYGTSDWVRVSSAQAGLGARVATGPDLAAFLGYLDAARDVETLGKEDIRGVSTTHYEGNVDLDRASAHSDPQTADHADQSTEQLRAQLGEIDASFDVWIEDGGTLRRMLLAFDPREGDGGFRARVDVRETGEKLDIEIPSEDQVVDLRDLDPGASG
jgi:hypothetical protein